MLKKEPKIIWITGLSGAGKTTLAGIITKKLNAKNLTTIMLDGDELRKILSSFEFDNLENHKIEKRIELALSYSRLCRYLSENGFNVVIATISLYRKVLNWNVKNLKNYYEVFLDVSLDELKKRDTKGIYKKFEEGKVKNIAGLDIKIDMPKKPKWHFKNCMQNDFQTIADKIIKDLYD